MPLWALFMTLGVVKLAATGLMLWLPLRSDSAMIATDDPPRSDSEDGGGGEKAPIRPTGPHPRLPRPQRPPRRGPHGSPAPGSPSRVRTGAGRRPARERSWR